MCERMGISTVDDGAIARIAERTEGVPLFVEEFCNSLMESGALEDTDQGLQLSANFDLSQIPSTLQDLLVSRLDRLETPNDLVYIGSAIGRDFSYSMIRAITGLDDAALNDELENLVQAELLYREGTPTAGTLYVQACTYPGCRVRFADQITQATVSLRHSQHSGK